MHGNGGVERRPGGGHRQARERRAAGGGPGSPAGLRPGERPTSSTRRPAWRSRRADHRPLRRAARRRNASNRPAPGTSALAAAAPSASASATCQLRALVAGGHHPGQKRVAASHRVAHRSRRCGPCRPPRRRPAPPPAGPRVTAAAPASASARAAATAPSASEVSSSVRIAASAALTLTSAARSGRSATVSAAILAATAEVTRIRPAATPGEVTRHGEPRAAGGGGLDGRRQNRLQVGRVDLDAVLVELGHPLGLAVGDRQRGPRSHPRPTRSRRRCRRAASSSAIQRPAWPGEQRHRLHVGAERGRRARGVQALASRDLHVSGRPVDRSAARPGRPRNSLSTDGLAATHTITARPRLRPSSAGAAVPPRARVESDPHAAASRADRSSGRPVSRAGQPAGVGAVAGADRVDQLDGERGGAHHLVRRPPPAPLGAALHQHIGTRALPAAGPLSPRRQCRPGHSASTAFGSSWSISGRARSGRSASARRGRLRGRATW